MWIDKQAQTPLGVERMRGPLPAEVLEAFAGAGADTQARMRAGYAGSLAREPH